MEFESFMFEERGMSAEIRGTEVNKTENGVHMECYVSTKMWNNEISGYEETRAILREVEGGEELYRELCVLLGKYGVNEWAAPAGGKNQQGGAYKRQANNHSSHFLHLYPLFPSVKCG